MTGIPFIGEAYVLKIFLTAVIIFMSSIVILLFFTLIIHKLYVEFRENRAIRYRKFSISEITRRLGEPGYPIQKPAKRVEFEAYADVLIDMLASISGDMEVLLRDIVRELGVAPYYQRLAGSRFWIRRFKAVEKLGFMRLPELRQFFREILRAEKDEGIIARAVLALSFIAGDEDDIRDINRILKAPTFMSAKFNEYIFTNVIRSFRLQGLEDRFVDIMDSLRQDETVPVILKRDIIEACGSECLYQAKPVILQYYESFTDLPELKITCIRALSRMGGEDVCVIIRSCFKDKDWRVRAVDVKHAYLCADDVVNDLRDALHDENYHVRINAAQSLSKLGEKGLEALRAEINSTDRFTSDVARYVLREAEIHA